MWIVRYALSHGHSIGVLAILLRSETINGVGIVRVAFQPGTNVTDAFAQVTSVSQTILRIIRRI